MLDTKSVSLDKDPTSVKAFLERDGVMCALSSDRVRFLDGTEISIPIL